MRRYPEYKESGVEWIGEIPKHWKVLRSKYLFGNRNQRGYEGEPLLSVTQDQGILPRNELDYRVWNPDGNVKLYKLVRPGDWVISLRAFEGGIELSEVRGIVSAAYTTMFPRRQIFNSYFKHLLKSVNFIDELNRITTGIRQGKNISYEDFSDTRVAFPPLNEQKAIGNFLDQKTGQIDELIRIKERQIELLQEKRTILINQTVTKGLDPNVEMKPSGVEWIGEIPAHWEIKKIKYIATVISEKSIPETDAIKISPENVESETGKILDFYSSYDSVGVKFQAGDVLFNKLRVYLSKVVFAEYDGYSLGEMIVIRPFLQRMGKYLFYLMLSSRFIEYCNSISYGVKMPRTAVDDILNAQIPMTSDQEQAQIVDFLDRKTGQIDELIAIEGQKVELLKEYRQSLIFEVVTGKIDVRSEI